MKQKEIEKKKVYRLYNEKYRENINCYEKMKKNFEKYNKIRRKNENMKILICKLMKENNILHEN